MPLIDRIRSLFARKGETEKKIALLSEQRTAFAQQLDRAYEEIGSLERRDASLRDDFKSATTEITKRRITGQLVQLRKDIERRQQLVSVLNQRVNVVATHLHNLELVRQDAQARLPDAEEIAQDAAAAEEMLAELQASTELVDSVGAVAQGGGMSAVFQPNQRVKVNLSGLTINGVAFSQNVQEALGTIVKQVSAEPSVYLVELLFSFKGIKRVEVPEDRVRE